MSKYHDFRSAKGIYIGKVLGHIHYKKLHTRIYEEISNHMDDMYEDFSSNCTDEVEITNKILNEMGDPEKLGEELKKAHSATLLMIRLLKIAFAISVIPLSFVFIVLIVNVFDEFRTYFVATDLATKESQLIENYNNGEPIKLLLEFESDGILHRYYLPEKQDESQHILLHIESIKAFGISFMDRFISYGRSGGPPVSDFTISKSRHTRDAFYIFIAPTEKKYIKVYYEPIDLDSDLESYWSDFIELPQESTYENPSIIYMECPDGYKWNSIKQFGKNKEPIKTKIKPNKENDNANKIIIHSSSVTN